MKVTILNCSFVKNSNLYASLLGKDDKPHIVGMGVIYINNVLVDFQGLNLLEGNEGTGLSVSGAPINFTKSHTVFANNVGFRGGAISLIGSTYILIDSNTQLDFISNMATDKGGAVYNRYIEMDNFITMPNCFVRHVNPFLNPDNWSARFEFANNTDFHGEKIHTSSILPCAMAGGTGHTVDIEKLFCWRNWIYHDSNSFYVSNCSEQVTSKAGNISLTLKRDDRQSDDLLRVVPGHQFQLPFEITDDYGNNLTGVAVLIDSNATAVNQRKYLWEGYNAMLTGPENSHINLTLDTLGDQTWHANLVVELMPCPPGLKPTHNSDGNETVDTICECSAGYLGALSCDPHTLNVMIKNERWIGKVNESNEYLVSDCPPGFCKETDSYIIALPTIEGYDEASLSMYICNANRAGVLCGRCVEGFGPAVNSPHYECVNCSNTNLASNIAKYVASIYLPLAILFTVLILFDIRLTTGPANAFILYCQVLKFSLDADGQVILKKLTNDVYLNKYVLNGYRRVYGIFSLEFVGTLLSPFCLSSDFNVLLLHYGVALFPLVMIIVFVLCLRMKECCSGSVRPCRVLVRHLSRMGCHRWNSQSISEALLPAFAAFILLSYTKFSIISSRIMIRESLTDENGIPVDLLEFYMQGISLLMTPTTSTCTLLPSSIIFAVFVCVIPILLLVYPLRVFEWCLSKVYFLWRWYPTDKVHVFLDTFQGCYKNNMRFFAMVSTFFTSFFLYRIYCNRQLAATVCCPADSLHGDGCSNYSLPAIQRESDVQLYRRLDFY